MKKMMTYAQEMEARNAAAATAETAAPKRREQSPRYVLAESLELTGTSYFPERVNEAGKIVPAVYSGWHDDELFRLLGEDASALNEIAPAWKQSNVPVVERGGQVVILGTKPGKSCRYQEPNEEQDFLASFQLNAGHLTGEVDIEGAKPVAFFRRASNG